MSTGNCNNLSIASLWHVTLRITRSSRVAVLNSRLSVQLTPPYSLFSNKDIPVTEKMTMMKLQECSTGLNTTNGNSKQNLYPLITGAHPKCPVIMTRAEIGLLGHYNKYKKSPFETFDVGGDGMTGYTSYASETIALRGYENGVIDTIW